MGRKYLRILITSTVSAVLILGTFIVSPASAEEDQGAIARGGKLYDKWFKVIKAEKPKDTHPAWPAANTKKKGNTTWRCKSCHGWDYQGKDGAYASGSYKTGIKGINGMAGADVKKIVAVLKDGTHKLAGKMDDGDYKDLALFVSRGQIDMSKYIDSATKSPKGGDAARGAQYFNTMCAQCHGKDGSLPKDMKKTLGKQMGNPWEVMHKILNGQPAEQMPALRALNPQVVADVMAHLSTLPKEK
jgi:Cytochrome C oxidase, cbb3-type, subunit III